MTARNSSAQDIATSVGFLVTDVVLCFTPYADREAKPGRFCVSFYGWNKVDQFFAAWKAARAFQPLATWSGLSGPNKHSEPATAL